MKTHKLKCREPYYEGLITRRKLFEIRYNDRDFQVGDQISMQEITWDGSSSLLEPTLTGRESLWMITFKTTFMQNSGYVVLGIAPLRQPQLAMTLNEIEQIRHEMLCFYENFNTSESRDQQTDPFVVDINRLCNFALSKLPKEI